MATKEETLLDWLRDAHAMEQQAITMLTAMGADRKLPGVKSRIEDHTGETRRQASALESCIERRAATPRRSRP